MLSPSQRYINWFNALGVSQRADVAFLVGAHIPGSPIDSINSSSETIADSFVTWIEQESAGSYLKHAAVTASLIAVTELMIIRKRDTAEGWAHTQDMLTELARRTSSETFANSAAQMEFRGRQWVASCDEWKMLRSNALSDHSIEEWMDRQAFGG